MVEPTRLVCCDLHEDKRLPTELQGADFVNLAAAEKVTGPFDLVIDTAGAVDTMDHALEQLAPSGRYVMIGQPAPGKPVCVRNARHLFEGEGKQIKATQGGGFRPDRDIPRYLKLASSIMFHRMVTHVFPLDKINAALDLVVAGAAGRVMIECSPPQALQQAA
jgi:S-(hydroxymethyl)glutathione dehydrogenase/alcohol dehydrogenase